MVLISIQFVLSAAQKPGSLRSRNCRYDLQGKAAYPVVMYQFMLIYSASGQLMEGMVLISIQLLLSDAQEPGSYRLSKLPV